MNGVKGRVLAVDPGEKRLGIAVSDPSGTIANPLTVLKHVSRLVDAASIAALAQDHDAVLIVIGQSLDEEGQPTVQGRSAARLAEAVRLQCSQPVVLWDEAGSTREALHAHIALGGSSRARRQRGHGHLDDLAATVILQSYLEAYLDR